MKRSAFLLALMSTTAALAADPAPAKTETIVLGGGCFWCVEAQYEMLKGVKSAVSGYANGHLENPTYKQVCNGDTGHNEVVQIEFDPAVISLKDLLDLFWLAHDPTTLNRQGNDVGTQYRSGIYTHGEEQARIAREVIAELQASGTVRGKIVTEVVPEQNYWPAEGYHQNYFALHPGAGYCAFVVAPKVEKFRQTFASRVRR